MKNSLTSQGPDLNSQQIKADTMFGSRSEADFYHVFESVIPPRSPFRLVPSVSIASVLPRTAVSHLISVIEGECRPIDPDPVKWDQSINVIRHNAELLRRKGQKPKLVDAGQLTLQLERS